MRKPLASLLLLAALGGCGGTVPAAREAERPRPQAAVRADLVPRAEVLQCTAALGAAGAQFSPLPDRFYGAGCATLNAVKLDRLGGDRSDFGVTNLTAVSCPLANGFAAWARYGVDRAARQILGSPLQRIETMGSYSCRTVAGTSRLSAHSRGEAIDVAGFVLADGRRITVLGDWNASAREREFLRVVHQSACKRFGMVLGPDYNAAHRDHFHLELGDGSYCR